jgi:ABC-2 type transport system ATP-binding protein
MQTILDVENLVKLFPGVRAVDGISFSLETGVCFGLLGPNGAGKTTAIEVIEGISEPTAGQILYKSKSRDQQYREEIGIQLQHTELPQFLTVLETLETYRNLYNRRLPLDELIYWCRLNEIKNQDNNKISGGQKQRLLLAIALANNPELVFLDEPTTGLDPQARRHLWDIVSRIKAENRTVVLTTHYMEEAQLLCDKIAIMDHGHIIAMGSPRELLEEHCRGTTIILEDIVHDSELDKLPCKWFRLEDRLEIQTNSITECMEHLLALQIDLSSISIRACNLDDLFLKLTGQEIRS